MIESTPAPRRNGCIPPGMLAALALVALAGCEVPPPQHATSTPPAEDRIAVDNEVKGTFWRNGVALPLDNATAELVAKSIGPLLASCTDGVLRVPGAPDWEALKKGEAVELRWQASQSCVTGLGTKATFDAVIIPLGAPNPALGQVWTSEAGQIRAPFAACNLARLDSIRNSITNQGGEGEDAAQNAKPGA